MVSKNMQVVKGLKDNYTGIDRTGHGKTAMFPSIYVPSICVPVGFQSLINTRYMRWISTFIHVLGPPSTQWLRNRNFIFISFPSLVVGSRYYNVHKQELLKSHKISLTRGCKDSTITCPGYHDCNGFSPIFNNVIQNSYKNRYVSITLQNKRFTKEIRNTDRKTTYLDSTKKKSYVGIQLHH